MPDALPPSIDFNGKWVNELGSSMTLHVDHFGQITGEYQTNVGAPTPDDRFPILGFATGDLISFTANFGAYGSLTSWAGQHTRDDSDNEVIKTLWILAKNVDDPDEPRKLWGAVLAGANNFRRSE